MLDQISVVKLFPAWVREDFAAARVQWLVEFERADVPHLLELAEYTAPSIRALLLSTD